MFCHGNRTALAHALVERFAQVRCPGKSIRRNLLERRAESRWCRDRDRLGICGYRAVAAEVVLPLCLPHRASSGGLFPYWISKDLMVEAMPALGTIYRAVDGHGRGGRLSYAAVDGPAVDFWQFFRCSNCRQRDVRNPGGPFIGYPDSAEPDVRRGLVRAHMPVGWDPGPAGIGTVIIPGRTK